MEKKQFFLYREKEAAGRFGFSSAEVRFAEGKITADFSAQLHLVMNF